MKITMYELLGMIKDGKAPELIKYDDMIWKYDGDYYCDEKGRMLEEYCNLTTSLNDKVEILEEEKKIPEKIEYYDDSIAWVIDDVGQLSDVDKVIIDKLNSVIDYLKSKGE